MVVRLLSEQSMQELDSASRAKGVHCVSLTDFLLSVMFGIACSVNVGRNPARDKMLFGRWW